MTRGARLTLYAGIVVVVVGLSLVHARWIAYPPYSYTDTFRFGWSLVFMAVLALAAYGFGLPDVPRSPRQALSSSVGATVAAALAVSAVQLFVGDALLPRFVVFGSAMVLVPWFLLCVGLAGGASATTRDRALVIGDSVDAELLRDEVDRSPERPVVVVAVLPVGSALPSEGTRPLVERAERDRATVVVLDRDAQSSAEVVAQAAELHQRGVRVRTLSLFYEEWLGMLPVSELERVSLLFDIGEVHAAGYGRVKRVLDIGLAVVGAIVLLVLIPVVVLANLVANRGPLFFVQDRVGKHGRVFRIHKLRTMRPETAAVATDATDAAAAAAAAGVEGAAGRWTAVDDARVTRFGAVLRRTHLDELPQVLDILRGDLSVVGPRPEQPAYVEQLRDKLPFYDVRHLVRPGLTGWAQVKYGYAGDERDALEKLQYEFFYLRHQGLGLDLRIIGRTVRSVLGGEGAGR